MNTTITNMRIQAAMAIEEKSLRAMNAANASYSALIKSRGSRFKPGDFTDADIDAYMSERERLCNEANEASYVWETMQRARQLMQYAQTRQIAYIIGCALLDKADTIDGKRADYKRTQTAVWRILENAGHDVDINERSTSWATVDGYCMSIGAGSTWSPYCISLSDARVRAYELDICSLDDKLTISRDIIAQETERLEKWANVTADECIIKARQYGENVKAAEKLREETRARMDELETDFAAWDLDTKAFYIPW